MFCSQNINLPGILAVKALYSNVFIVFGSKKGGKITTRSCEGLLEEKIAINIFLTIYQKLIKACFFKGVSIKAHRRFS